MSLYPSISTLRNSTESLRDPFVALTSAEEIAGDNLNLRVEYDRFVAQHGFWVLFRKFDKTRRSQYWDASTQSSIGGPAWEYTDVLTRVYYSSGMGKGAPNRNLQMLIPGASDLNSNVYYLRYDLDPCDIDQIIEIDPCRGNRPTTYTVVQMHEIHRVDPMRDSFGRVEFFQVLVRNASPKGDATLV